MRTTPHGRGRRLTAGALAGAAAGTVVAALALAGPATAASATTNAGAASGGSTAPRCTDGDVTAAQHQLETDLANRATALSRFAEQVSSAKHLSSGDASALQAIVTDEQTGIDGVGIEGLQQQVPSETTCSQLAATAKEMVVDFRVYALVARQVGITVHSSQALFAATTATNAEPRIEARIQKAAANGKDVSGAEQAYADLQSQLSSATQDLSGIDVGELLAQQPSDYPGDASMLKGDSTTMAQAGTALKAARTDLRTIRQDLRGASAGTGSSGSTGSGSAGA